MDGFSIDQTAVSQAAATLADLQRSLAEHSSLRYGLNPELLHGQRLRRAMDTFQKSLLDAAQIVRQDTAETSNRLHRTVAEYQAAELTADAAVNAVLTADGT